MKWWDDLSRLFSIGDPVSVAAVTLYVEYLAELIGVRRTESGHSEFMLEDWYDALPRLNWHEHALELVNVMRLGGISTVLQKCYPNHQWDDFMGVTNAQQLLVKRAAELF